MRISDWSSDVCSSDLDKQAIIVTELPYQVNKARLLEKIADLVKEKKIEGITELRDESDKSGMRMVIELRRERRSEEHTSELQSLMRISYAVFCLKKKIQNKTITH